MNEDLKINISKIVSLVGDPSAILPNLHPSRSSQAFLQNESKEVIVKSEPLQEIAEDVSEDSTKQPSQKIHPSRSSQTLLQNESKEIIVKSEPLQEIAEDVSEDSTKQPSQKKRKSKNSVSHSLRPFIINEDLKIAISKIVSKAGDPCAILPNLHPSRSSQTSLQNESREVIEKSETFQEIPEEVLEEKEHCKSESSVPHSENNFKHRAMTGNELRLSLQGDKVFDFCQEHRLIATQVSCFCGNTMRLGYRSVKDGCAWTCYSKVHKNRPRQSIRKGTWFENANITITEILWIAYMWVHEYSPISMLHECDNSNNTVIEWSENCLNLCQAIMEKKKDPIGGMGKSVEIYECKITNRGSIERWAFCAIELHSTNVLHLIVDNKKSNTVFQIFDKYILPGTKVVTNDWSPLKTLTVEDFIYLRNDKSISFYDLSTSKDIDTFQDFKRAANKLPSAHNKLVYGASFLESIYRKSLVFATDKYLTFLHDVSLVYKPPEKLVRDFTTVKSAAAVEEKEDLSP